MKLKTEQARGFTIVELLIVIVVIAVLAAVTVVAYNGIRERARDSQRKLDVTQIGKLLNLYAIDNGAMFTGSGCGSAGNGSGWFNFENGGTYPISMNNCLKNANISPTVIVDPSGLTSCAGLTCHAYMKYTCNGGLDTYVFANLETVGHTGTETDATCAPSADTSQGINYFIKL